MLFVSIMSASRNASSTKPIVDQEAADIKGDSPKMDFGPDLKLPSLQQYMRSFFSYALPRQKVPIAITIFAAIIIYYLLQTGNVQNLPMHPQNATAPSGNILNFANWLVRIQSLFNISTLTFIVALFVWLGEIREDWENDLPKRLSVFFFDKDKPRVVCRYAWLAGPDELRTWGQQVAKQAAGNEILDFSPNVEAQKPTKVVGPNGFLCMHYAVCFRLTKLNSYLKEHPGTCYYQNCAANNTDVVPFPLDDMKELHAVKIWLSLLRRD
jgi:hypothetical protein